MTTTQNGEILTSGTSSTSGWRSLGDLTDYRRDGANLLLFCDGAAVQITPLQNGVVRVRLAPDGAFGRDHSWAIESGPRPDNTWRFEETSDSIEMHLHQVRISIQRSPCRIDFRTPHGSMICADDPGRGLCWEGDEVRSWKVLRDEDHFFGLGEKGSPLDKRGGALVNWNHDAAEHEPWTDPLYQTHPFLICLNDGISYGLFFDNTFRSSFDFGKSSRHAYSFGADGGELNYYFIPGPAPTDVVQRYADLVGRPPLPPIWALGFQQCRWSYDSAKRVRDVARQFRKRRIPCDTIYIDIDYMDGFRCFTWDPKRFANPAKLMNQLTKDGFKSVVIIDPGIKVDQGYSVYDSGVAGDHFCYNGDGRHYIGKVWPGESVYPDYTRKSTRKWWGELYEGLVEAGVTGIWNDMNEPADFTFPHGTVPLTVQHDNDGEPTDHRGVHNIYGMQMARATFDGLSQLRPGVRPFVLTRAGYSGVQRYGATWTGDNLSSWEHLRMSIPMLLNMSVSGIALCGADVGGFRGYPSPELFTRWLQLGVFYPLMRVHTAGGKEQDPWSFGKKHEKLNRRAIELRYRLLPYIYTEMQHASRIGLPLLRPVFLDYPMHPKVHKVEHEFLFGRQIFVAPVVQEGAKTRKVTLPEGEWHDFETGHRFGGGEEHALAVSIDSIPMFAKAGAIIPTREVRQFTDEAPLEELTLHVFPGQSGEGWFYNDDGSSYDYREGAFTSERYVQTSSAEQTTLQLADRMGSSTHAPASYLIRMPGVRKSPASVSAAGQAIPRFKSLKRLEKAGAGWHHDADQKTLWVRIGGLSTGETVDVHHKAGPKSKTTPPTDHVD